MALLSLGVAPLSLGVDPHHPVLLIGNILCRYYPPTVNASWHCDFKCSCISIEGPQVTSLAPPPRPRIKKRTNTSEHKTTENKDVKKDETIN